MSKAVAEKVKEVTGEPVKKAIKVKKVVETIKEDKVFILTLFANKAMRTRNKPRRMFKVTAPIQVKVYDGENREEVLAKAIKRAENEALDAVREVVGLDGVLVIAPEA